MSEVINLQHVSKYYPVKLLRRLQGQQANTSLVDPSRFDEKRGYAALKDLSFQVEAGQAIGLVGRNGAGKSTLLRILAGTTQPSEGVVQVNGRVGALLTLLVGLEPHMTGRENIHMHGALIGLTRSQVDAHIDEIIAFSELGDFVDAPMATYSSGMRVRLAFSASIHLEADILLIDEVLAVGDKDFQERALKRMRRHFERGKTVVIASHNLPAMRSLCQQLIWLEHGRLREMGPTEEILEAYLAAGRGVSRGTVAAEAQILEVRTLNALGSPRRRFPLGETVHINFKYEGIQTLHEPVFQVTIFDFVSQATIYTIDSSHVFSGTPPASGSVMTMFKGVDLPPRQYRILVSIYDRSEKGDLIEVDSREHTFLIFDPLEMERLQNLQSQIDLGGKMLISPLNNQ
jgi:ABC-2 type transport system ATP-binding protein